MTDRYLLIALALLPLSSGLYFHIGETERKCFIEEIPDETMVTGRIRNIFLTFLTRVLQEITKFNCMIRELTGLQLLVQR